MDRKTVYRWISGKTPRISSVHLRNLAELLACEEAELLLSAATVQPVREQRWEPAWKLAETRITEIIGPSNNFTTAAQFLESTIEEAMPVELKARLRLQLARVYQRLHRVGDMRACANFILDYAATSSDLFMERRARFLLATAELMDGNLAVAKQEFERHIAQEEPFLDIQQLGSAYSNLAATLSALGEFEASLQAHVKARRAWLRQPMSASNVISAFHYTQTLSELGRFAEAMQAADECEELALSVPYERQRIQLNILRADILCGMGKADEAAVLLDQYLPELLALPNFDIICLEFAARTLRLSRQFDRALESTREIIEGFERDLRLARILIERARLARAMGELERAREFSGLANEVYRGCGVVLRVSPPVPLEYWDEAQRIAALS